MKPLTAVAFWGTYAACLAAGTAHATEPSDLSCEPNPSPPPGATGVPLNPLLFGFGIQSLTDASGNAIPTLPAPPPWDLDSRYRVPAEPLQAAGAYTMTYELQVTTAPGTFVTGNAADTQPPSPPGALWHGRAADANQFIGSALCATDELELFGLDPSTDDLTPQADLRYDLSLVLSDGGLAMVFNELTPQTLPDAGLAIAVEYGLQGLPGDYVLQARDLAGNLSGPSAVEKVEIGPGCDFATSTTGQRSAGLWQLLLILLLLQPRRRSARAVPLDSRPR